MNFGKKNVKEMKERQAEDNGEREGWSKLKRPGEPYPITSDRCTQLDLRADNGCLRLHIGAL